MEIDGLVLELIPVKEQDAMMRILTDTGIVAFYARRVMSHKHEYHDAVQPFSLSHFWVNEGPQQGLRLAQARLLKAPRLETADLGILAFLDFLKEVLMQLGEDSAETSLLKIAILTLDQMKEYSDLWFLGASFLAQTLGQGGWRPEIDGCVACGSKTAIVAFDGEAGGFVCRKHYRANLSLALEADVLKAIRYVFKTETMTMLSGFTSSETLFDVIAGYYETQIGFKLKSTALLKVSLHS